MDYRLGAAWNSDGTYWYRESLHKATNKIAKMRYYSLTAESGQFCK
jgi:hypothetical protein